MANVIDVEKYEKLIIASGELLEKLENLPFLQKGVIYIVGGVIVIVSAYLFTKLIMDFIKEREFKKVLAENNQIMGEVKAILMQVADVMKRKA